MLIEEIKSRESKMLKWDCEYSDLGLLSPPLNPPLTFP